MKAYRHTVINKVTAILMIGLMLFINAVKLFHTHPVLPRSETFAKATSPRHSTEIQPLEARQMDHCAICDFKLTKDADITGMVVLTTPLIHTERARTTNLSASVSTFQSTNSGRAPPALA